MPHPTSHYTSTAKALHWLIALLIIAMLILGFYLQDLPFSPRKLQLMSWHKWAGVSIFFLVVFRLAWRLFNPPPALPEQMSPWQQRAAHLGHWGLYALMLAIPLSGWLMSSAKGVPTVWFGIWRLPDLLARDAALGQALATTHWALNLALVAMLIGHVGAAVKHHLVDQDDVLIRMLPGTRPGADKARQDS